MVRDSWDRRDRWHGGLPPLFYIEQINFIISQILFRIDMFIFMRRISDKFDDKDFQKDHIKKNAGKYYFIKVSQ